MGETHLKTSANFEVIEEPQPTEIIRKLSNAEYLRKFLSTKKVEGCSEKTLVFYRTTLSIFIKKLPISVEKVSADILREYLLAYAQSGVSPCAVDNTRRIISSFYNWLEVEDYIIKNPMRKINKIRQPKRVKEVLSDEDIERIISAACDTTGDRRKNAAELSALRNPAIVLFLSSTGVRVGEIVGLNRQDIDFERRECVVFGKGSKERRVYFDARTKEALKKYLSARKDTDEALFVNVQYPHNRIGIECVQRVVKRAGESLGINKVHPHKFRRSTATRAITKGMPIEQVQKLLGHARLDTTMIYAQVADEGVRLAHKKYLS